MADLSPGHPSSVIPDAAYPTADYHPRNVVDHQELSERRDPHPHQATAHNHPSNQIHDAAYPTSDYLRLGGDNGSRPSTAAGVAQTKADPLVLAGNSGSIGPGSSSHQSPYPSSVSPIARSVSPVSVPGSNPWQRAGASHLDANFEPPPPYEPSATVSRPTTSGATPGSPFPPSPTPSVGSTVPLRTVTGGQANLSSQPSHTQPRPAYIPSPITAVESIQLAHLSGQGHHSPQGSYATNNTQQLYKKAPRRNRRRKKLLWWCVPIFLFVIAITAGLAITQGRQRNFNHDRQQAGPSQDGGPFQQSGPSQQGGSDDD